MKCLIKNERVRYILILLIISFVFCIPFFLKSTIYYGDDLVFHLNRIHSLSESIKNGTFYPYIFQNQNFGYGYSSPIFYSIVFLYPAALLNCLGLTTVVSYKIMIFIYTILTCFSISYLIKIFTNKQSLIIMGVIFYIFCPYRITDVYARAALGEILSFLFLPVILTGIYYLFYDKPKIWPLVIGFSGVLLSHNISFFFSCVLFAIFCIINFTKIIRNKNCFKSILIAILLSICLTLFYLLPMLEQMNMVSIENNFLVSENVVNILEFVGFVNEDYLILSPNILLIIIPVLTLNKLINQPFAFQCFIIAAILSLILFIPEIWNFKFLTFIQFPWRLLLFISVLLIPAFIHVMNEIDYHRLEIKVLFIELILISLWCVPILKYPPLNSVKDENLNIDKIMTWFGDSCSINRSELANGEYLLNKEFDYRFTERKIATNPVFDQEIEFTEQKGYFCFNSIQSEIDITYIIPKTYYKGYAIKVGNEIIYPYQDENDFITFVLPAVQSGEKIQVFYLGTRIQKLSLLVSLISFTLISIGLYIKKFKLKDKGESK